MRRFSWRGLSSLVRLSDEQAMERVRNGDDPGAFALLVRRWEGPIRRLCARMTGDAHRAEDLAQEAFARLFVRRKHYRPVARFSTFLRRIAVNLCYDELRRLKRRPECPLEEDGDARAAGDCLTASGGPPDAAVAQKEHAELVRAAVLSLPEHYRAVVVLRHYEGLKFREIAEVLDIPPGTVKSRMAEALSRLARDPQLGRAADAPGPRRPKTKASLAERTEK
jgi:RNA polymerase sigma-70 factor (ECF subfamily)